MNQKEREREKRKDGEVMKRFSVGVSGMIGVIVIIGMFCLAPPCAFAADQAYSSVNDYDAGTSQVYGYDGSGWSSTGLNAINEIYSVAWDRTNSIVYASGTTTGGNGLVYKRQSGTWTDISPTAGLALANAYSVIKTQTGDLYTAGWSSSGDGRVYKNGGTGWVDTDLQNVMNAGSLAVDPSGNIYVGGKDATGAYGVVNKYSGGAWSLMNLGQNIFGEIYSLTVDSAGHVYVGGTDMDLTNGLVYKYDGTWGDTGLTDYSSVYSLTADGSGNVYAGGETPTGEGIVSKYSGSWTDLAITNGTSNDTLWVESVSVDSLGNLYAGGENYAGAPFIYENNGSWSDVGVPGASGEAYGLTTGFSPDGPSAVPEPFSMAVGGLAIGILELIKRSRRKKD